MEKKITVAELEDTLVMLFETRSYELDNLPDSVLIMKYYSMALEDVFYRLTKKQLDLGVDLDEYDLEPLEVEDTF
jgi:hypothetical protein